MTSVDPSQRIYLIGLMGSGKSTVGRIMAQNLGWGLYDLDGEIEKSTGLTITDIFEEQGEAAFRELEKVMLAGTRTLKQTVISCGGGIILQEENILLLKKETTIWLEVPPAEAAARVSYSNDRPLMTGVIDTPERMKELLKERRNAYMLAARISIETGGKAPEIIAQEIINTVEQQAHGT